MPTVAPDTFQFTEKRGRKKKYDWSIIADGQIWMLQKGVDFDPSIRMASLRSQIYRYAHQQGLVAHTEFRNNALFVRFTPRSENQ